jgi:predicted Zn finger-like uncharacterized protein
MTLATRCPSCGTVFRVVQDQLRVSEGWVRCGRCDHVFHAVEVLFDIDSGASVQLQLPSTARDEPDWDPPPAPPAPAGPSPTAGRVAPEAPLPTWAQDGPVEPRLVDDPAAAPEADRGIPTEEQLLRAPSRSDEDDPIVITDHTAPPGAGHAPGPPAVEHWFSPSPAAAPLPPEMALQAPASAVQAAPSFMQSAERGGAWRKPAVRLAMGLGLPVLAGALLVQVALLWRDPLAAHLPPLAPALQALCQVAGCTVQPLRRIELLALESSGLNRLEGSAHPLYRLQLVLRNRADTAVMPPSIDLALTDNQGRLVARRVLAPSELALSRLVATAIPPGAEVPVRLVLSTGERRVDGYTVELFYP